MLLARTWTSEEYDHKRKSTVDEKNDNETNINDNTNNHDINF